MMNELIKQLAAQANSYAISLNPEQDSYGCSANPQRFQRDRDTKFAELIVQECIRRATEFGVLELEIREYLERTFGIE